VEKAYAEFQIETVEEGERRPEGGGRRQGGIPRDSEIRFWANCLASSSSDSFGSRFPGVKPNRLLKRDDARIVPSPFPDLLFSSLIVRQCSPDGWNEIRLLLLVTGITHRGRIYDGSGQINRGLYDLTSTLRSFLRPSGPLSLWRTTLWNLSPFNPFNPFGTVYSLCEISASFMRHLSLHDYRL